MITEIIKTRLGEVKEDAIDVGVGVGASIGLFAAGLGLIELTGAYPADSVESFVSRLGVAILASLANVPAAYISSRLRHGKD